MSYQRRPDLRYRMPSHFGPSPGPRQRLDDGAGGPDRSRVDAVWARWPCDPAALSRHLPVGFEPAASPELTVEFRHKTDVGWLAGRGYNMVLVTATVVWTAGAEIRAGSFELVVWENLAEPIITGRDEVGMAKLFANVSDVDADTDRVQASASWDGFTFLELDAGPLEPADITPSAVPHHGEPEFRWKYVPATGHDGGADADYGVMTPPATEEQNLLLARRGVARVRFRRAGWQQLPTLFTVVTALADLGDGTDAVAGSYRASGSSDRSVQIRLGPLAGQTR